MQIIKSMNIESMSVNKKTTDKAIAIESDIDVIRRVLDGEVNAFEVIMRRYNQRLYRIARSILKDEHEAMDAVQDAYIKIYYQLDTFKGPDGFASWLSRITSNEALMRLRKLHRINYTLDDPMHNDYDEPAHDAQPLDLIAEEQLRHMLEQAVDQLPVGNRCVYMMRAVQQLSTRETAQSLDVTEEVVKTRYLRAKRLLQKIFEGHVEKTGLGLHEFDGNRCDSIVLTVMTELKGS